MYTIQKLLSIQSHTAPPTRLLLLRDFEREDREMHIISHTPNNTKSQNRLYNPHYLYIYTSIQSHGFKRFVIEILKMSDRSIIRDDSTSLVIWLHGLGDTPDGWYVMYMYRPLLSLKHTHTQHIGSLNVEVFRRNWRKRLSCVRVLQ